MKFNNRIIVDNLNKKYLFCFFHSFLSSMLTRYDHSSFRIHEHDYDNTTWIIYLDAFGAIDVQNIFIEAERRWEIKKKKKLWWFPFELHLWAGFQSTNNFYGKRKCFEFGSVFFFERNHLVYVNGISYVPIRMVFYIIFRFRW